MIFRAVQNLGKVSKRRPFHTHLRSFAGSSFSQSTYERMDHPRQLHSMPLGGGMPSEDCKRADLSKNCVLINEDMS